MALSLSRGPSLDTELIVQNAGGNRFDLVIMAAARARELARAHKHSGKITNLNAPVQALLDFQEGKCGPEYIKRVR
jgi:DNA-directed RNA polymerase subunit K/omega